jgi:hypothetical protein
LAAVPSIYKEVHALGNPMMRWRDTRTPYDVTVAGLTSKGSAVFYGVDCPMINKPTFYPRYSYLLFYWLKGQGIITYRYNVHIT